MKTNTLVIGQGISGTLLSWFLYKAGIDFLVLDKIQPNSASNVAAGLINPVTGRRVVKVWLDDILLPFAEKTYGEIGSFLKIETFRKTRIIDFFPNPFMKESFQKKLNQQTPYIQFVEDPQFLKSYFNYEFGSGVIDPCYIIHSTRLQHHWRHFLMENNLLLQTELDFEALRIQKKTIRYKEIEAERIIFCDGALGGNNPYFSKLPFALHKGEAIVIEAPDLLPDYIYKKSMAIVPLPEKGLFWVGTNYIWDYDNLHPTPEFREATNNVLKNWLKLPYKIIEHRSAIRPATVERRPFVGFHPLYSNLGILNGLGTKGFSLAPYFAHQLCENITNGQPILPEADIKRFSGVLSRGIE